MAYADPATAKQRDYILALGAKKQHSLDLSETRLRGMTRREASRTIGLLQQAPVRPLTIVESAAPLTPEQVFAARYPRRAERRAAEAAASKGFYAVQHEGRLTFVQVRKAYRRDYHEVVGLQGAPGGFNRRWLADDLAIEILAEVAKDPFDAMLTFGLHYSVCGKCSAELTDATSRERHFGPDCWSQLLALGLVSKA